MWIAQFLQASAAKAPPEIETGEPRQNLEQFFALGSFELHFFARFPFRFVSSLGFLHQTHAYGSHMYFMQSRWPHPPRIPSMRESGTVTSLTTLVDPQWTQGKDHIFFPRTSELQLHIVNAEFSRLVIIFTVQLSAQRPRREIGDQKNFRSFFSVAKTIESHIHLLHFNDHTRGNVKTHHCERRMSSTSTGPAGEENAFPFNNANESKQWPTLSIIGVVLAVLGFLTIMWFIFWIFWREKRLRQRAPAGEATNHTSRQEQPLPMLPRYY
ncbi:hypothetical protein BGZ57DRAFT_926571 [Hyaloscypha finlandica]|nr:hypothetical protein BGZ57DRAFT_926571 [Hyaloscypha finlandica]